MRMRMDEQARDELHTNRMKERRRENTSENKVTYSVVLIELVCEFVHILYSHQLYDTLCIRIRICIIYSDR